MTAVTFKNNPVTLLGQQVNEGETALIFTVLDNGLNQVTLDNYKGKKKLISVVPSIDTGVCDQQTRKFNEEASQEDGVVLTISVDLPFAQKRWCASNGLDNVITLSDHKIYHLAKLWCSNGRIKTFSTFSFVLNENNKVVYKEIVSEGTNFPDFDAALEAYRNI